jgi:hypothetical protein
MKKLPLLVAVLTANFFALCLHAQTPAFEPSSTPAFIHDTSHADGGPVNLGMVFTPNVDISTDALGFYAIPSIAGDEEVGIYDSSGNLLSSVDVTSSDPLSQGYYWASISSLALLAGHQYTVDSYTGNYDLDWEYGVPPTVNADITYDGQTYDYTTSLAFPTSTVSHAADAYYGPNFSVVSPVSTVPDGGLTALLLGAGLVGLVLARRRLC